MSFDPNSIVFDDRDSSGFDPSTATALDDKGGFVSAAKQVAGRTIKGVGQAASDFLPGVSNENPLTKYGQEVIDSNPTAIQGFGDIADNPLMAIRESSGNAIGSILPMLGARAIGQGITAAAPLTGPAAPFVAGAGQLIAWGGPTLAAALPSYSGIRDEQIEANPENEKDAMSKAIAAGGAGAVGMIERFGPSEWALKAMKKEGREALIKQFADSKSLPGAIGKGIIRGGAVEGAEEIAQNPIEQLAAYQDPTTAESLQQTMFSGAMGAIGGGVMGGGMQGVGHIYAKSKQDERDRALAAEEQQPIAGLLPAPKTIVFPDGTVGTQEQFDAYIKSLKPEKRVAAMGQAFYGQPSTEPQGELMSAADAQANADRIYAERAAYEEAMAALYPYGLPTVTVDTAPLRQHIDEMLGIDQGKIKGLAKVHYQRELEKAFNEQVGITNDKNGHEIPLTMGMLLDSQATAEQIARDRVKAKTDAANQSSINRLAQVQDEETQPAIPVVGPLSAMANAAVQSGVTQQMQLQQAAKQAEAQAAKAPEGKKKFPFRKPAEQAAEQVQPMAAPMVQEAPIVEPVVANNPVTPLPEQGAPEPVIQQQEQPVEPVVPEMVEGSNYAKREDGTPKTKGEYTPDEWAAYTKSVIDKKLDDLNEATPQTEQTTSVSESVVAQNEPVNTNSLPINSEISTPEDEATYRPLIESLIKNKRNAKQLGFDIEGALQKAKDAMHGKKQMPGAFRKLADKAEKLGDKETASILRQIADLNDARKAPKAAKETPQPAPTPTLEAPEKQDEPAKQEETKEAKEEDADLDLKKLGKRKVEIDGKKVVAADRIEELDTRRAALRDLIACIG